MFVMAIEVDKDHVHMNVEIPPQLSVGTAVRLFKSLSARHMMKRFPYLRRQFWGEMWSPSSFVRTVGEGVTAETVRRYIETHEQRSDFGPAQAELLRGGVGQRGRKRKA